jgi:hypothetical protein
MTIEVSEKTIHANQKETLLENTLYTNKNENIIIRTIVKGGDIEYKKEDQEEETSAAEEETSATEEEEASEAVEDDIDDSDDSEEHIVELFNIKIRGHICEYYTDNAVNGNIYTIGKLDEIGPNVGKFVNGKVVMNKN